MKQILAPLFLLIYLSGFSREPKHIIKDFDAVNYYYNDTLYCQASNDNYTQFRLVGCIMDSVIVKFNGILLIQTYSNNLKFLTGEKHKRKYFLVMIRHTLDEFDVWDTNKTTVFTISFVVFRKEGSITYTAPREKLDLYDGKQIKIDVVMGCKRIEYIKY